MSNPETTGRDIFDLKRAQAWLEAVQEIDLCRRAIRQYAELGISGCEHDAEHKRMLQSAEKRAMEVRP